MEGYDPFELQDSDFAPVEATASRLPLLSLEQAHDLLRVLVTVAQEGGPVSPEGGPAGQGDRRTRPVGELSIQAQPGAGEEQGSVR
ncbi:DUF6417 family protein [Streptomyces galbus]|uniref:DUF6417 family protein n=1 Tax=Streptomyces galbus TaxID=33898 RepID=UPI0019986CAF|nr:DUF6417 family protein [Streptomyces galbus]GHD52561.1 hypothetical protein GCM10010335_65270 [Streptomyces galbus]